MQNVCVAEEYTRITSFNQDNYAIFFGAKTVELKCTNQYLKSNMTSLWLRKS